MMRWHWAALSVGLAAFVLAGAWLAVFVPLCLDRPYVDAIVDFPLDRCLPVPPASLDLPLLASMPTLPAQPSFNLPGFAWDHVETDRPALPTPAELAGVLAPIPDVARVAGEIAHHLAAGRSAKRPVPRPVFPLDPFAPQLRAVELSGLELVARWWVLLAAARHATGDRVQALALVLGCLQLAHEVETRDPQGLTVTVRYFSIGCRRIAFVGLSNLLAAGHLDRNLALAVFDQIMGAEADLPGVGAETVRERLVLSSALQYMRNTSNGIVRVYDRRRGPAAPLVSERAPVRLLAYLAAPGRAAQYADLVYGPLVNAATMSYATLMAEVAAMEQRQRDLRARNLTANRHLLAYLADPAMFHADNMVCRRWASVAGYFIEEVVTRQLLRGVAVAGLVHAYRNEVSTWPTSLAEVASWSGRLLPPDLCGDQPLDYGCASPPRLVSRGRDAVLGTADDLVFLPLPTAATAAVTATHP